METEEKNWRLWQTQSFGLKNKLSFFTPVGPNDFYWRWKRYRVFLREIGKEIQDICEIGSGSGLMTMKMLKHFPDSKATLIDMEKENLEFSKKIAKENFSIEEKRINCIRGNVFKIKQKEQFDLVHSQGLIEHFYPANEIIQKHIELTKKNGHVLILAPRNSFAYWNARKTLEAVKGKWPFGFELPVPEEIIEKVFRENKVKLVKKKNFLFSYGYLGKKLL